jgi:hypothetical protein
MRRRILVISRNEQIGRWFRFMLSGLHIGLPTTVVSDLEAGIRALTRLHPHVVIFVDEGNGTVDDKLMLLQALLLIKPPYGQNTLALLYDLRDGRFTMYHHASCGRTRLEDVARAAAETVNCPLFGYAQEEAERFPAHCRFRELMAKGAPLRAASMPSTSGPA